MKELSITYEISHINYEGKPKNYLFCSCEDLKAFLPTENQHHKHFDVTNQNISTTASPKQNVSWKDFINHLKFPIKLLK